ncbi:type III-B CRISPR module RAMP protein Cmr4 [Lihuaxuella thermophila]|uniref:CRISPR-associated protein Cmr4 n=1 Tax=Lihuaxuella thermophila TaxID=1173111 RepID=A0A1H8ILX7_9BACL|nr:type III-B CRISPR module RAMP protein Cmr4 [Lihuaxuella thermophila]SEN68957.1 CRISPR-associated protein Cmr4 [Lihuaxuella thermophila]
MKGFILGMLAETPVHPGAGQSHTGIDQPVAREATTGFPVIPGSGLKGALRDKAEQEQPEIVDEVFGNSESAGGVGITDARILLLPIRSLTGHYRWITCPYLLERYQRDLQLIGGSFEFPELPGIDQGKILTADEADTIFLEELSFEPIPVPQVMETVAGHLSFLIKHESVKNRLVRQLAILHDDDFSHFAHFGLPIQARNQLENGTKKSQNLWFEETLPPDTLLYSLILERPGKGEGVLEKIKDHLKRHPYLQAGGNETVGQGWLITAVKA